MRLSIIGLPTEVATERFKAFLEGELDQLAPTGEEGSSQVRFYEKKPKHGATCTDVEMILRETGAIEPIRIAEEVIDSLSAYVRHERLNIANVSLEWITVQ